MERAHRSAHLRRLAGSLRVLLSLTLGALSGGAQTASDAPPAADADGGALFSTLCARCHGLLGDGRGEAVLDRPARNFRDGGFSFGNTEQALERTIRQGIPGSPMPGFGEMLDQAQIDALVAHVQSLAPTASDLSGEDRRAVLTVDTHAVALRGLLPPVESGDRERLRGLLLGLPGGLSWEYDGESGELLAVRYGEFARRSDWGGRGGTALEPLGVVIERDMGRVLAAHSEARLAEVHTGDDPRLVWSVLRDSQVVGRLTERPGSHSTPLGQVLVRRFELSATSGGEAELRALLREDWNLPAEEAVLLDAGRAVGHSARLETGPAGLRIVAAVVVCPARGGEAPHVQPLLAVLDALRP